MTLRNFRKIIKKTIKFYGLMLTFYSELGLPNLTNHLEIPILVLNNKNREIEQIGQENKIIGVSGGGL